jgi:Protein of unknown function (DUF3300)
MRWTGQVRTSTISGDEGDGGVVSFAIIQQSASFQNSHVQRIVAVASWGIAPAIRKECKTTMRTDSQPFLLRHELRIGLAALCTVLLLPGDASLWAGPPAPQAAAQDQESKIPPDQLDSLVAPIALYPDPILAQVLAASTYPLQIIQLQQWLAQHKDLKDKALADAVMKQDWDSSIQAMAPLPDVVKRLADDIKWTTDLGNAFLAQQSDVMEAIQRMRAKAKDKGNLKSSEQMKVETKTVESKQVIIIQQANPEVVYVPSYSPTVVYGPPVYPYPPIYYPPAGYYAAGMALSFGVGMAMGAAWGGGWGNCGWGGNNDITINNNNNFNRNTNVNGGNRQNNVNAGNRVNSGNRGGAGSGNWQHNPSNRGGTPYSNKSTANKYGGTTRGSSQAARQNSARQQTSRAQSSGNFGGKTGGRSGGASAGTMDRGAGGRGGGSGAGGNRAGAGGGGDRVGNRSTSGSKGSSSNGFGGSGRNSSGGGAKASSSRGSSSMGGSRGGGGGRRR